MWVGAGRQALLLSLAVLPALPTHKAPLTQLQVSLSLSLSHTHPLSFFLSLSLSRSDARERWRVSKRAGEQVAGERGNGGVQERGVGDLVPTLDFLFQSHLSVIFDGSRAHKHTHRCGGG